MSARVFRLFCLLSGFAWISAATAQEGHPLKGTWVGEWGPTAAQRHHIVLLMEWDGKNITGAVNPGENAIPLTQVNLEITPGNPHREARGHNTPAQPGPVTVPTFGAHIEATAVDEDGNLLSIVADGSVEDIGIPNRLIVGTWLQTTADGTVSGDFKIRRQ